MEQITITRDKPDDSLHINSDNWAGGEFPTAVLVFFEEVDRAGCHVVLPDEPNWTNGQLLQALINVLKLEMRHCGYEVEVNYE